MDSDHTSVLIVSIVALGVGAQWISWRFRVPAIILLALAGLAVGPVLGIIDPREIFGSKVQPIVSLCVAVILFEGGLNLHFRELKVAASGVRRLVYLGAPLAWLFASVVAHYIGGLSWGVAAVFGAIMVVTGPTVIMPMLRQARLNRRTASYFKWEGIVNDPIGALLAVLTLGFLVEVGFGAGWQSVLIGVTWALISGTVLGGVGGWLVGKAFQKGMVPEYLKSPVMLGLVLVVFTGSNSLQHEAGLLAVTVMGVVVGNMHLPGIQDMKRFKEYITVMLVAVVFVVLTAMLDPQVLQSFDLRAVLLILAILFIVRPLTVWVATLGSEMELADRALLGWIAPRGIVAAATAGVMGPRLVEAGYPDGELLLPLVFAVIFSTVFLHGSTIGWCAKKLNLISRNRDTVLIVGGSPWTIELAIKLKELGIGVMVADNAWHNLRPARLAGVPVFYGEILSEFAEESVEINTIGHVLAATSNDAYNSLVCTALAPEVGRNTVFQLPMGKSQEDDPRSVSRPLRGQIAFDHEALFEKLWRLHVRGWKFARTTITDSYSYSDFLGDSPAEAIKIMIVNEDQKVSMISPQAQLEPTAGQTILYFAPERERSAEKDAVEAS